jgi:hypothetical protein
VSVLARQALDEGHLALECIVLDLIVLACAGIYWNVMEWGKDPRIVEF